MSVVCAKCGRERREDERLDYTPVQVVVGAALGWYSGDDGEMCGDCMSELLRGPQ